MIKNLMLIYFLSFFSLNSLGTPITDLSGNLRVRGLTTAGPISTSSNGTFSSAPTLGSQFGGTGQNFGSSTGIPSISGGTWSILSGISNAEMTGSAGITNANLATVSTATIKGRTTAGTGTPEDLTGSQATALLSPMVGDTGSGGTKGLVPAPASGDAAASKYLKADGTWTVVNATGSSGNFLQNGTFQNSPASSSWTVTNSTASTDTTTYLEGTQSLKLALSSQSGTLLEQCVTPGATVSGQNWEYNASVKTALTGVSVCAVQNSVELTPCQTVSSDGSFHAYPLNFPAYNGGSNCVRLKEAASSTGDVNVAAAYMGAARNIGTVAQSYMYGALEWPAVSEFWQLPDTTSLSDFPANTSMPSPTPYGHALAPATKVPEVDFTNAPPGEYLVVAAMTMTPGSANAQCSFQLSDGASQVGAEASLGYAGGASGAGATGTLTGRFFYTSPQSSLIFKLQSLRSNGTATPCYAGGGLGGSTSSALLKLIVYYFPSQSQQAVSVNAGPFFTDWAAYTPTYSAFGTVTSTDMWWRRDGDSVEIKGSFTVASVNSSTAAFSLPNGIVADSTKNASTKTVGFYINENPSGRTEHGGAIMATGSSGDINFGSLALFSGSAIGNVTTPLQSSQMSVGTDVITVTPFRVPIAGWTSPSAPVPILVGSVSSNSAGAERVERLRFGGATENTDDCTASPCTIYRQSGAWVSSITRSGSGVYAVNFASNMFSAPPVCVCSSQIVGNQTIACSAFVPTTAGIGLSTFSWTAVDGNKDSTVDLICMGPR